MKLWKKTMLLAFCVAMTAAISSCDMISGMLGGSESDTGSSVEAPASESTPATSEPDSESTSDSTSEEDVKVEYTVTFKQDGCEDIVRTVEKGKALADVPTPQGKTGYTVKWNITNFAKITKDTVVTAVATPNTYTVTYKDTDVAAATFTFDAAYELATPTKEGFKFLGWFVGEEEVPMTGTWTTANDVELTAKWQAIYTVTFVQNGYDNVVKTVLDGEALTDIPATQAKTGYTVVWETVDLSAVTGDMTVNAVETANTYTITFDMDGGTGAPATMEVTFDGEYELPAPTKTDYNFVAWLNGENSMANTGVWNIASDVTLVASWVEKDKCVITFVQDGCADVTRTIILGNDLTDIPAPQAKTGYTVVWDTTDFTAIEGNMTVTAVATPNNYTVTYVGVDVAPATFTFDGAYELATPTKEGFKFLGWFMGDTEMPMTGTWTTANNVELTAKWQAIYTVTFVQNGYDNVVKSVLDGEALTDIPAPQAKTGYTVVWGVTDFSAITGNMTVTAVETANKYTLTYDANGGTAIDAQEVTFDAEYTLATPTRGEYKFAGWYVMDGDVMTEVKFEAGVWNIADNVTIGAKWTIDEGVYAMKYNFNVTDSVVTQITKKAYPGGSTVSFQYYIPEGTTTGWWGIAWHTDPSMANNYHAAGIENAIGYKKLSTETGAWVKEQFTLPEGGEYYLYFGAEIGTDKGNWMVDGANSYALIDNFKIGAFTETFDAGIDASIFQVNVDGAVELGAGYTVPAIEEGEYALKYMFNADGVSMISKKGYAGGSKVSFKYYIPADAVIKDGSWWGIAWHNDPSKADMYHAAGIHDYVGRKSIKYIQGTWVEVELTIEGDANTLYYLYFGSDVGGWKMPDGSDAYVFFDDFTVNEETDNFNKHIEACMFDVLKPGKVVLSAKGEGYVKPTFEPGEYAMKYICNISGETVSQVTKKAYAGGSTVSFQYYIPEGTEAQWWGVCWSTKNTGLDIYAAAGSASAKQLVGAKIGEWTTVEFTLPDDGNDYYIYFGSEVGHWKLNGENAYILIDNFKVSGEGTEDFNSPMENWAFDILFDGAVTLSDKDAGIADTTGDLPALPEPEAPVLGDYGAKIQIDLISSTKTTPSFITAQAYTFTEDTVVSFDYYMSGNTNNKWWTLGWAESNTHADIYAGVAADHTTATNNGKALPTNIQDVWATATVTVPAGTWYIYFAGAVGEWSGGSVIIDNVKFGDTLVEDFNDGTYGIFLDNRDSKPDAITIAEGKYTAAPEQPDVPTPDPDAQEGEYAAQVYIDKIGGSDGKAAFITKEKYAAGSEVTIRYFIPEDVTSNWLAICGPTDANNTSVYENWLWNGTGYVKGAWSTITVTLKEDCYIQIGGAVGDWGNKDNPKTEGYILIDDFTVNGEVVEDFNKGLENSAFNVNTPGAVVLADGYVEPVIEASEYAMKYICNASGEVVSQVTKQAYAGGSTVSFKYYIPEGTETNWWGICWSTTNTGLDIYAAAGTASAKPLSKTVGEWTTVEFTLPEGGEYYLYFGSEVGHWKLNGENAYILIDDFTVNGVKETFNNGMAESMFDVLVPGTVVEGEGYVPAPQAAKIMLNNVSGTKTTPSFITSKAYSGVATITFDCYITGNPNNKWWCLNWTADKANANIYAFNNNDNTSDTANGRGITTANQDTWQTVTIEIPEGEWYFFFGGEKGQWGNGYVILDNIVFKDADGNVIATENFDEGFIVFENNRASDISLVEGKTE